MDKEQPLRAWTPDTWKVPSPHSLTQIPWHQQDFQASNCFPGSCWSVRWWECWSALVLSQKEEYKVRDMKMMRKNMIDMGDKDQRTWHISYKYWYNRRKKFRIEEKTLYIKTERTYCISGEKSPLKEKPTIICFLTQSWNTRVRGKIHKHLENKLVTYKGTNNRLFQTSLLQQQMSKTVL